MDAGVTDAHAPEAGSAVAEESESVVVDADLADAAESAAEAGAEAEADAPVVEVPVEPARDPIPDETLIASVDLARTALLGITPERTIGEPAGYAIVDDHLVSLLFENTMAGYPGWFWTVTLSRTSDDALPNVLETELMPGDGALLAPQWVPWSERLADYRAAQIAAAAAADEHDDDLDDDEDEVDEDELSVLALDGDDEDDLDDDFEDDESDEDDEDADSDDDESDDDDLDEDDDDYEDPRLER